MSDKPQQLPLKGFMILADKQKKGWVTWIEGMGNGRFRIHQKKASTPQKSTK